MKTFKILFAISLLAQVCASPASIFATFYLIEACGWKSPVSSQSDLQNVLFEDTTANTSVQTQYEVCSHNRLTISKDTTLIIPVTLNCTGNVTIMGYPTPYDFQNNCGTAEYVAWYTYSESYAKQSMANDKNAMTILSQKGRRTLIVLPNEMTCPYRSTASSSCIGSCVVILKGAEAALNPRVIFNRIQNTFGVTNAAKYGEPEGDLSDASSNNFDMVCQNAPFTYKLGWGQPLYVLGDTNFTRKANYKYIILKPLSSDINSMIQFRFESLNDTYYASYRVAGPLYDHGLPRTFDQKLSIHKYNVGYDPFVLNASILQDVISAPNNPLQYEINGICATDFVWTSPANVFRLFVISNDKEKIIVHVCKIFRQREAFCENNWDLDCDGLYGYDDPDCM